jgi:hypothetical protein
VSQPVPENPGQEIKDKGKAISSKASSQMKFEATGSKTILF